MFGGYQIRRFLFNMSRGHGSIKVSPDRWRQAMSDRPPEWMTARIETDFSGFRGASIKHDAIDQVFSALQAGRRADSFFRVRILGNAVTIEPHPRRNVRFHAMKDGLEYFAQLCPIPSVDFILSLEDMVTLEKLKRWGFPDALLSSVPLFVFAKKKGEPFPLIPDFSCFASRCASYSWLTHLYPMMEELSTQSPWNEKKPVASWRGAATGISYSDPDWENSPRISLCKLSVEHPDLLDAKFTLLSQMDRRMKAYFVRTFPVSSFEDEEELLRHKYQVCMDGNTCPYPGLQWRLLSNCAVIKQETDNIQWFYDTLKPFENYIPVKKDLSDLIEKINWSRNHDEESKRIADNGTRLAREVLSAKPIYLYLRLLLTRYSELLG